MITKELRFNGSYVDLMPNTVIALTFQAGDIGDLRTRAADFTQTINIPKTKNNRKLFGNIDLVNSRSATPYRKGRVDYWQSGLNIITGGTGVLTESDEFYKLSVYNGIVDFFSAINGKNVDDIDFGVYETIDLPYLESIMLSTDLFSAPVIDFGTLFPHPQELKNTNFIGLDGWSNDGPGVQWDLVIVGEIHLVALFQDSSAPQTAYLTQDYKFFKNFRYRISFSFDVPVNDPSAIISKVDLYIGTGASRQLIGQQIPFTSTGSFIIDEIFIAGDDYDTIEIYAEATVADPGESARIRLLNIKVTDIAGIIDILPQYYVPLISYSQVIEKIVTDAGYSLNLDMSNQAYYERLYITYSKSKYEYPDRLIDKMKFRAIGSGSQFISISDTAQYIIEFPNVIENGEYKWYDELQEYQVPSWPYSIEYVVNARIIVEITFSGGATSADFYFTVDGLSQTLTESIPSVDDLYVVTFSSLVMITDPTTKNFSVTVGRGGGVGTINISVIEAEFWSDVDAKAFDVINLSALILPTKSQKDFIKDFLMRFGILTSEKNGILRMVEMQRIISKSYECVDWTSKRDKSFQESIKFDPKNYAQENIFDDITSDEVLFLGSSSAIDIDDETLSVSKTFYTSIMAAVQQNNNSGMRLCRIELFDLTDNSPTYISSPALVYLRENKDGDSVVLYGGFPKASFLVAVYNDPLFEFNTTWKYFLDNYYLLISAALQRAKTVQRSYNLKPLDISSLDMFRLVRDEGQLYLINSVQKYIASSPTKVEIFKVL